MICGIYKILNTKNNKIYIGSSININKRITRHFNELRKNKHCNDHLQSSWNKYGEKSFIIEIIVNNLDKSELINKEQEYIDLFLTHNSKMGYNLCPKAYNSLGYNHSIETRKKMSEERKINSIKYARYGENHWNWGNNMPNNAKNYFRDNHPDYNGEKSPRAKLNNEIVLEIRKLYETGKYTYNILGKKYFINKRTVGKIINRERWKNI